MLFNLGKSARKITSLLFILPGFIPLIMILVFIIKEKNIRHRMEGEMEKKDLQTVIIPENEVIWMDKHEIWVNNSMFDILTKTLVNGIYTFTGLYDEEETRLVEAEKNAAQENNEENKLLTSLFDSFPGFCHHFSDSFRFFSRQRDYKLFRSLNPVSQFREILTPPPQVAAYDSDKPNS